MVAESVIAAGAALLGGLVAAGATLLGLFWRMGRAAGGGGAGDKNPDSRATNQRLDDLRDYLEGQFDTVDQRFETMQAQLDRRFDAVVARIDTVDEEVGKLEARVDDLNEE